MILETNMFSNLSFVVSHWAMIYWTKISTSKFIDYVLMHVFTLVYQVSLTSKIFNWYSTSIGIIWNKSLSNWYMQGNYIPPKVCMVYNPFNWYSCQFFVILGLPPCMIWSKLSLQYLDVHLIFTLSYCAHTLWEVWLMLC